MDRIFAHCPARIRTSFKEDIKASAVELVYGFTLRVSGEFFDSENPPTDLEFFIEKFRVYMRQFRAQPTAHHIKPRPFILKDLKTCSHVFVREDAVRRLLTPAYSGPFRVVEHISDRLFSVDING